MELAAEETRDELIEKGASKALDAANTAFKAAVGLIDEGLEKNLTLVSKVVIESVEDKFGNTVNKTVTKYVVKYGNDLLENVDKQVLGIEIKPDLLNDLSKLANEAADPAQEAAEMAGKAATRVSKARKIASVALRVGTRIKNILTPFFIFDIASMAIDFLDVSGYNNFKANDIPAAARNAAEVANQKQCLEYGIDYPQLFDLYAIFPDLDEETKGPLSLAYDDMYSQYFYEAEDVLLQDEQLDLDVDDLLDEEYEALAGSTSCSRGSTTTTAGATRFCTRS